MVYVYGVVVAPPILVHGPVLEGPDCHCMLVPLCPVRVNVTVLAGQTAVGETLGVPAIGVCETKTVTVAGGMGVQPPEKVQVYVVVTVGEAMGF